jgi:hypothetical protein
MKKFIVITTINRPTGVIEKLIKNPDWRLIIVGDKRTPHEDYLSLERACRIQYVTPEYQENTYPELSAAIGWNTSSRRCFGFIEAYNQGCDVLALLDDDNFVNASWGKDIIVGKETEVDYYETSNKVFEPLAVTNVNHIWHRGYPFDLVRKRFDYTREGTIKTRILVQANLWNGNPDIDAMQRILFNEWEEVYFDVKNYYTSNAPYNPFNSQNTILAREVIPYFMLLPHLERIDDIWGSYLAQSYLYKGKPIVAYGPPTVYQERNEHDLFKDFDDEIYAYQNGPEFIKNVSAKSPILPEQTQKCFELYRRYF